MKRTLTVLMLAVVSLSAYAGEFQSKQVAANAKWVAFIDVQAALDSQIGKFVMEQVKAQPDYDTKHKEMIDEAGFDPLTEIKSVTAYGVDAKSAVAVVTGTFKKDAMIKKFGLKPDFKKTASGDYVLYSWTQKEEEMKQTTGSGEETKGTTVAVKSKTTYLAFFGDDKAVSSDDKEAVKNAMAVLAGKADRLDPMSKMLTEQPKGTFAFVVVKDIAAIKPDKGFGLPAMKTAHLVLGETDKKVFVTGSATMAAADEAKKLRQMAQGFLAMIQMSMMQQGDNAQPDPVVAAIINGIEIGGDNDQVTVKISLTVDDIKAFVKKTKEAHKGPAGAVPDPSGAPTGAKPTE